MVVYMAGFNYRRSLSTLIATIILVAITVAASLVIHGLFTGVFSSYSQNVQCLVSIDLIRPGGSASYAVVAVTVRNTGSVPIKAISVQYVPEGQTSLSSVSLTWDPNISDSNPLPPGASASASVVITTGAGQPPLPISGKTYTFIVKATGTGGQTFTETLSVTCGS
jgi:FlaG/FlaF family flagellin (archaellin)